MTNIVIEPFNDWIIPKKNKDISHLQNSVEAAIFLLPKAGTNYFDVDVWNFAESLSSETSIYPEVFVHVIKTTIDRLEYLLRPIDLCLIDVKPVKWIGLCLLINVNMRAR